MSKLNKRRSEYLDDDNDDGLPRSPVPAVTTADVILGEPLKKQLGQFGKTSSNRDSDQSLISVDSSENEEEELFLSKWKSSVPARKSASLPATSSRTMDTLDFNSIQKTELLVSKAAKHKMKVKPARKANRQSVKHRDTSSPTPLPSLNEESPTSLKHEDVKEGRTTEKVSPSEDKPSGGFTSQSASVVTDKIDAQAATDRKHKVSSINISSKGATGSPLTSPTSPQPLIVASAAAVCAAVAPSPVVPAAAPPTVSAAPAPTVSAVTAPPTVSAVTAPPTVSAVTSQPPTVAVSAQSPTVTSAASPTAVAFATPSPTAVETATTPVSPTVRFPPQTGSISDLPLHNVSQPGSTTLATASVAQLIAAPKVYEKKSEENLSLSDKGDKTILSDTQISYTRLSQSQKEVTDNKFDTDIKSRMSRFQMPGPTSGKLDAFNSTPTDSLSVKATNLESTSGAVLKEDYKVKHQVRSRTLPAVIGEQTSPKVQRSSSHRIPNSGIDFPEPRDDSRLLSEENVILSSTSVSLSSSLPDSKKPESVKVSSAESKAGISASEPSWMNMVRRKKSGQETNIEIEKVKTEDTAATRPGLSTSAPKSIFTSSSYLEKKRGSTDTVSFKGRELSEAAVKKVDSSDTKRQSLDLSSQNKQAATEASSSSKESVEVEVTHLGSVKASRGIFDSSSKFVSQRDSTLPTPSVASAAAERIRKFSSSSSVIPGSNSVKASSNTNQEVPVAAAVVASDAKLAAPVGGITHARGGSVKASLTKTTEVKSSVYTRNGSVKGPSTMSAASSSTSESPASASVRAEAASTLKPDSVETAPPSALPQPSAQHVPAHVAAPPNPSLPSQTSSVTPLTYLVQPFNAYSSNPSANFALASRPAYAATQRYSKLASAPTNTAKTPSYPAAEPALIAAKTASISNIKLLTSSSIASSSNAATSSFALPNVSSSSSSSPSRKNSMKSTLSSFTQSSSLSSSALSVSHSSTTQALSSITSSTAFKSHSSHVTQFNTTSTSSIRKSSSFKTATTSSEKVVPFQKVVAPEKPTADVKKQATPAKVPAWRTNLSSKEVKIEIIENSPSPAPTSSTQTSSENLRKPHDKTKQQETSKKTESSAAAGLTVETEKTTRRTSKVLDMVKNFQNLQAPS